MLCYVMLTINNDIVNIVYFMNIIIYLIGRYVKVLYNIYEHDV